MRAMLNVARCELFASLYQFMAEYKMDINSSLNGEPASAQFGAHSAGEIPVPIPNTEVKPSSGDYTAIAGN